MSETERNRTERHPIVALLREQGRSQSWLARRVGRTHEHTNRVLNGIHPATAEFRAACATALGVSEVDLFHDISSAAPNGGAPPYRSDEAAAIRRMA